MKIEKNQQLSFRDVLVLQEKRQRFRQQHPQKENFLGTAISTPNHTTSQPNSKLSQRPLSQYRKNKQTPRVINNWHILETDIQTAIWSEHSDPQDKSRETRRRETHSKNLSSVRERNDRQVSKSTKETRMKQHPPSGRRSTFYFTAKRRSTCKTKMSTKSFAEIAIKLTLVN